MARKTVYTLYKTGRVDPTLAHIWAFETPQERYTWLNARPSLEFSAQKYWRVGNSIKIPVSYETSFEYDYIRIINDIGTPQERIWYAFIAARAYISPSVTVLSIDVDYIQTFYFNGQTPFWDTTGFIVKSTAHLLPLPGTPSDYPVPQSQTLVFANESGDYAFIVYSTIDPTTISGTPTYTGSVTNGVYSAAAPYVIGGNNAAQNLNTLIGQFNTAGLTDAIVSIYAVPARFFKSGVLDGSIHAVADNIIDNTRTFNLAASVPLECSYLLDDYDYTYIIVNNGQGETAVYHGYEFSGDPEFSMTLSLSGGCPTLYFTPTNLRYNALGAAQQHGMKITQAISCTYLNDSYRIWLAQTQNSRAAAVSGAELAISQAEEARSKSWAYQSGSAIETIVGGAQGPVVSALDQLINGVSIPDAVAGTTESGVPLFAELTDAQAASMLSHNVGLGGLLNPGSKPQRTERVSVNTLNAAYTFAERYLYKQLGIETRYTYDHAVANAQQSLNALMASYKDKARIPATARGSNAYGDMALYRQYGFMTAVVGPSAECYTVLNNMLRAGGHTINRYNSISRYHDVFDYYQVNSARIAANASVRPEFVRKLMLDILQNGVYLWYIDNGDISQYFGTPYGIQNDEVTP